MKFMNLLQTVGKKVQDKITAEGIDQNDLINEATNDGKSREVVIQCSITSLSRQQEQQLEAAD